MAATTGLVVSLLTPHASATDIPLSSMVKALPASMGAIQSDLLDDIRIRDFSNSGAPDAHMMLELSYDDQISIDMGPFTVLFGETCPATCDAACQAACGMGLGARMSQKLDEETEDPLGPRKLEFWSPLPSGKLASVVLPAQLHKEGSADPATLDVVATESSPIEGDTDGNLLIPNLTLDRTEIGDSGIIISATQVALDLHATKNHPLFDPSNPDGECTTYDGAYDPYYCHPAWKGVVLGAIAMDLPDDFGGVDGVEVSGFLIGKLWNATDQKWEDGEGFVKAEVNVNFDGEGLDLGGMTASLSSICVQFGTDDTKPFKPTLCGIEGAAELPSDWFACMDDPEQVLPISLEYSGGAFVGTIAIADIPTDCRRIQFGSTGETYLELGGEDTPKVLCDKWKDDPENPAAYLDPSGPARAAEELSITVSGGDPFAITLEGKLTDGYPASLGTLRVNPEKMAPQATTLQGDPVVGIAMPDTITIGSDGLFLDGLDLPPLAVGGSGVVICAENVTFDFHEDKGPPGMTDLEWMGLHIGTARVLVPLKKEDGTPLVIGASDLAVGEGGLTGTLSASGLQATFAGFEITELGVSMTFVRTVPTGFAVGATMNVPFFEQPLTLGFSLDGQGGWRVEVKANGPDGIDLSVGEDDSAIYLKLLVHRIAFACQDGDCHMALDTTMGLKTPVFDTGDIKLDDLKIHKNGRIELDGAWKTFDEPKVIKIAGFAYELSKLGFGTQDNGRRYIGIGGHFQLQDVLPVQISVNEMLISWNPQGTCGGGATGQACLTDDMCTGDTCQGKGFKEVKLEIKEIELFMEIPEVLVLKGTLKFCDAQRCKAAPSAVGAKWFDAHVEVQLKGPKLGLEGRLMVGKNTGPLPQDKWTFWFAQIGVQLPKGIPIPATGVSIYGFEGGFGKNVALNLRDEFPRGLDVDHPVYPDRGSFVFLAGVTLGTGADNGFLLNMDVKLLVQIPGPVVVFNGQAWIMTKRDERKDPPLLTIDIIFDGINKQFIFALAVRYQAGEGKDNPEDNGMVVDASGNMEVLVGKHDWHVFLGTKTHPISAKVAKDLLGIEAETYVMFGTDVPFDDGIHGGFLVGASISIGSEGEALGGSVGYKVGVYAFGELGLQMQPKHVLVTFGLGGEVSVWLGPLSLGLSIDALLKGQTPTPANLYASLAVALKLPWPFKSLKFNIELEWTPDNQEPCPDFPEPLKEVVLASEATGETVRFFPNGGSLDNVPFDAIAEVTFNRRMDCRNGVRPCSTSENSDYFWDKTAGVRITNELTGWSLEPSGTGTPALEVAGGWGGRMGDEETLGATAHRRYETFTFRPVQYTFTECPGVGGSSYWTNPDLCRPVTTPDSICRVHTDLDTCWESANVCETGTPKTLTLQTGLADGFQYGNQDTSEYPHTYLGPPSANWATCPKTSPENAVGMDYARNNRCRAIGFGTTANNRCDHPPANACLTGATLELGWKLAVDLKGGPTLSEEMMAAGLVPVDGCDQCGAGITRPAQSITFRNPTLDQNATFDFCEPALRDAMYGQCQTGTGALAPGASPPEGTAPPPNKGATQYYTTPGQGVAVIDLAQVPGVLDLIEPHSCDLGLKIAIGDDTVIDYAKITLHYKHPGGGGTDRFTGRFYNRPEGLIDFDHGDELVSLGPGVDLGGGQGFQVPCLDLAAATGGCCSVDYHPITCARVNGPDVLVNDYFVKAGSEGMALHGPSVDLATGEVIDAFAKVGTCEPYLEAMSEPCPSEDPSVCGTLLATPSVLCTLFDGTPIAPASTTTAIVCDPPSGNGDGWYTPGAPFCPDQQYQFSVTTEQTRVRVDSDSLCPPVATDTDTETFTYTIAPPPDDLNPYIAWTSPALGAPLAYRADDVVIQFNTGAICELYSCCPGMAALDVFLRDDRGQTLGGELYGYGCPLLTTPGAGGPMAGLGKPPASGSNPWKTLGQEDDFLIYVSSAEYKTGVCDDGSDAVCAEDSDCDPGVSCMGRCADGTSCADAGDCAACFDDGTCDTADCEPPASFWAQRSLQAETHYEVIIPNSGKPDSCEGNPGITCTTDSNCGSDGPCVPPRPLYVGSFTTSRFLTFEDALASADAYVSADSKMVYVETSESLDWLHTTATLNGVDVHNLRTSSDVDFVHVFNVENLSTPPAAGDTLTLTYHSVPHGRCVCEDDAECVGGGRCTGGLCQGGRYCDLNSQCQVTSPSGLQTCQVDGPVVRRRGHEVQEIINLVLEGVTP